VNVCTCQLKKIIKGLILITSLVSQLIMILILLYFMYVGGFE